MRLDEISKIENYFIEEINQRKSCSRKLNKYVAVFDYFDQGLIVSSATSGEVSIISFTSIVGASVGIASALIDMDISHEELVTILKEKGKYEKMKENLRCENEEYKIMRLSSIKSKIKKD